MEGTRFFEPRTLRGVWLDGGSRSDLKRACDDSSSRVMGCDDNECSGAHPFGAMCFFTDSHPRSEQTWPSDDEHCFRKKISPVVSSHALSQMKTYETDTAALARGLCLAAETVRRRSMRGTETSENDGDVKRISPATSKTKSQTSSVGSGPKQKG